MSLRIADLIVNRVLVIDDDPKQWDGYGYPIEEMGLQPVYEKGPLRTIAELLASFRKQADALVCDYHLRIKNFSDHDGDHVVASCNYAGFPALLCTTFADGETTLMRSKRRYIPTLLKPDTYNPDAIHRGFERCVNEHKGIFDPSRKPWRTLVRIVEVVEARRYFYVLIPGWDAKQKIRVYLDDLPAGLHGKIKPSDRMHAQVNLGATSSDELYFSDWESA